MAEAKRDGPRGKGAAQRKDRLIQTRVPRELEGAIKEAAQRRRLTVSHLIRNVLEDAFDLVHTVVDEVDHLVSESAELVEGVRRIGRRTARDRGAPDDPLAHVCAWNAVVLNRDVACSGCGSDILRGEAGFAGLSDEPDRPRAWLCAGCSEGLGAEAPRMPGPRDPAEG
jgi:hypothetical protein